MTLQEGALWREKLIKFYINTKKTNTENQDRLKSDIFMLMFNIIHHTLYSYYQTDIFFLPASKSGLYEAMNIFSAVFAKLSQLRHLINERIEIPALSEPMSDYFLHLSTINNNGRKDIYADFAQKIESDILGATIQFNHDTKKLEYYQPEQDLRLEISETSSMVSEIAPLVAYLKFIINESKELKNGTEDEKMNLIKALQK